MGDGTLEETNVGKSEMKTAKLTETISGLPEMGKGLWF
jgi:hypothetical protein